MVNEPAVDAMRMSDIAASTKPPPAATPLTALITGSGTCSSHVKSPGTPSPFGRCRRAGVAVAWSTDGVEPGAEAAPRAGDDDADDARVGRRRVDRVAEAREHRVRQRVQRRRAVQRDGRHGSSTS